MEKAVPALGLPWSELVTSKTEYSDICGYPPLAGVAPDQADTEGRLAAHLGDDRSDLGAQLDAEGQFYLGRADGHLFHGAPETTAHLANGSHRLVDYLR